jgi:hypothetical protein
MSYEEKKSAVEEVLGFQTMLFNPHRAPRKACDYQFTFKEAEGDYDYHLAAADGVCRVASGTAANPLWWVVTDVETWRRLGGGYLSGKQAMRAGRLSFKKGMLRFLRSYGKTFGGRTDFPLRKDTYLDPVLPERIEKVLVLSCSHRGEKGVTQLFVERLKQGMVSAGAEVNVMFPVEMNIHPCCGEFHCWRNREKGCIYRKDDMALIWEAYEQTDLLVWATPIYAYFGTSAMKRLMERFFSNLDYRVLVRDGKDTHPAMRARAPYFAFLATCGFWDMEMFEPLTQTMRILVRHRGTRLIAGLVRPSSMSFLVNDQPFKTRDDVLEALVRAGEEMVRYKAVDRKTAERVKQPIMPRPMMTAAANYHLDKAIEGGDFFFERPSTAPRAKILSR